MDWIVAAIALALVPACYSPSIQPCRYTCNGTTCPDGLSCNGQGMCASSADEVCGGGGGDGGRDAPIDAELPPIDTNFAQCGWNNPVSNVDPCALEANLATLDLNLSPTIVVELNTDTLSSSHSAIQMTMVSQTTAPTPGPMVALVKLRSLTSTSGGTLTIRGSRPLIILVHETVNLAGDITVAPDTALMTCPTMGGAGGSGQGELTGGGGAGGGGFGTNDNNAAAAQGGRGGQSDQTDPGGNPGLAGTTNVHPQGAARLTPLVPGCSGGRGGSAPALPTPVAGGFGGDGGGALQIASRTSITISGQVLAPGAGGRPSIHMGSIRSGAGGGGAGGAILLEAPTIALAASRFCANGGGGGGGNPNQGVGQDGTCGGPAGGGIGVVGKGGNGGAGATRGANPVAGGDGAIAQDGGESGYGGGGGGGGVGRIRINGTLASPPMASSPAFTQ